jgi:hypothetical protein
MAPGCQHFVERLHLEIGLLYFWISLFNLRRVHSAFVLCESDLFAPRLLHLRRKTSEAPRFFIRAHEWRTLDQRCCCRMP